MDVYLLDGTYELFRYFFAMPSHRNREGREVAATRGVLGTVLSMLEGGATHLGVATDRVIESFRNDLWPGYKTSAGVDPEILQQFPLIEEGLQALGVMLWPMVELEADDALGAAAVRAAGYEEVGRVFICSPDKDLAQCVRGERVIQLERRTNHVIDEAGVVAKFGVLPASIPDYLALVGDSADGYPGLPGWGARSAATVLARFGSIEAIPPAASSWGLALRGAEKLAQTLRNQRDLALLFKDLATLRSEAPVFDSLDALRWRGPRDADFAALCDYLDAPLLLERARILANLRR
ncbi:MAG: flap endonuclease [Dehalococcoidia bacterium]|nr:flap endonuclease [Dehalococcoidia bacterium]